MATNYPRLEHNDVRDFISSIAESDPDIGSVKLFLQQKEVDESKFLNRDLEQATAALIRDCEGRRNKALEPVEAKFCGPVYRAIEQFPDEALGDEAFWSYLSVRYFWQFISYRQQNAWLNAQGETPDPDAPDSEKAKLERYIRGKDHYQIPLRMYLRAQSVKDGDDFSLTDIEAGGTDFWRSQILGVLTAAYPPLARSVVRAQELRKLSVEQQRPPGRRVNRLRVNIDFILHDEADAAKAIEGLWELKDEDVETAAAKKALQPATSKKKAPKSATSEKLPPSSPSIASPPASSKPRSRPRLAVKVDPSVMPSGMSDPTTP